MLNRVSSKALMFCVAGLFFLPFLWPIHSAPITSFYSEWIAAVILLAACLFCAGIKRDEKMAVSIPAVVVLFAVPIAILSLQLNLGMLAYVYNATFPVMILLLAIGAVMLGSTCSRIIGLERLLFWISVSAILGGVLSFGVQLIQLYGVQDAFSPLVGASTLKRSFYYANLGQTNQLTTYLSWSLICTLYLYAKRSINPPIVLSLITIFLTGLAFAGSRTSWLLITWIAFAGGYLTWRMDSATRPRYWYLILVLPLCYLVVTLLLPWLAEIARFDFGYSSLDRLQTKRLDAGRALIYAQAWEVFLRNPVLGVGFGEFAFSQFMLMGEFEQTLGAGSAHNLILDLLVTSGLVGASSFIAILGFWFWRTRKKAGTLEYAGILLMITALGIHAMLEYPEWYGYFLWPVAFFLGCLETRFFNTERTAFWRVGPIIGAFAGLVVSAFLYSEYSKIEELNQRLNSSQAVSDETKNNAPIRMLSFYDSTFFTPHSEALLLVNLGLDNTNLRYKLDLSERAVRFNISSSIIFRRIVWLAMADRQDEAAAYLAKLVKTYPQDKQKITERVTYMAKENPETFGKLPAAFEGLAKEGFAKTNAYEP